MNKGIYDLREDEINIDKLAWNDPKSKQLAWKNLYITQKMIDFWQPWLDRGEVLFNMYDGRILDETRRAIYEQIEDKIVIEPPIMKASIRALLGHAIQARKSGAIGVEDGDLEESPDNAYEIETIDIAMKHMEKRTKEQVKIRDAIHDSMVSCYPNVLLYQKRKQTGDNPLKYGLSHPAWNSCVFGPINTREPDLSDITELVYMHQYTMGELVRMYPKQEKALTEHWGHKKLDDKQIASIMEYDDNFTASDISSLTSIYNAAYGNLFMPGGLMPTFMRIFPLESKQEVFINVNPDEEDDETTDYIFLPENWGRKRREDWIETNKDKYEGPYEKSVVTLWQCVFTQTGFMLSNKKHWYQNKGKLPATMMVPCLLNGKPSGPAVDMAPETLRNCIARIEYLDDMRKGDGQLFITKEGTLTKETNENITAEANKALGVAYVNKDYPGDIRAAYAIEKRNPSTAWRDYGEYEKQEMTDITRINEAMQGGSAPRQSAIAKQNEIGQALVVSAIYFDNFNLQWENHQNLKLSILKYNYDESMMQVEAFDEKENTTKAAVLNQPNYDTAGEKDKDVLNDMTAHEYRWMVSPVDDSPSAKARYMQDALLIINGSAGPLMQSDPSGKLLSNFWAALDNPILKEAGKRLAKDAQQKIDSTTKMEQQKVMQEAQAAMIQAQADAKRADHTGVNISFTGEQLAQYPSLLPMYQALVSATSQAPQQAQQPGAAQLPPQSSPEVQNVGVSAQSGGPVAPEQPEMAV